MSQPNPKVWSTQKRNKKYGKISDVRKANPNGLHLKRPCNLWRNTDNIINIKTEYNESLTPINKYINKKYINPNIISSNLSNILKDTNPKQIVLIPKGRKDNIDKDTHGCNTRIYVYYPYTIKQKTDNEYYKIKQYKYIKKYNKEIKALSIMDTKDNTKIIKEYIPPIISDTLVNPVKMSIKKDNDINDQYLLIDLGLNINVTAFGSIFEIRKGPKWIRDKNNDVYIKNDKGRVIKLNKYTLYFCYDKIGDEIMKCNDIKDTKKLNRKRKIINEYYFKNNNNNNNNNHSKIDDEYKLEWYKIGDFNGNLDKYNIDAYYNGYYKTIKIHKLNGNHKCRWIKLIPHDKNELDYKHKKKSYNKNYASIVRHFNYLIKIYGSTNNNNNNNNDDVKDDEKMHDINNDIINKTKIGGSGLDTDNTFQGCRLSMNIMHPKQHFVRRCDDEAYWGRSQYERLYYKSIIRRKRYSLKQNANKYAKNKNVHDWY